LHIPQIYVLPSIPNYTFWFEDWHAQGNLSGMSLARMCLFSRCAPFQVLNPGDDLPHLPRIKFNEKSTRHHNKRVNYDSSPWIERDERACFAGSLDSFWLCDVAMNSTKLSVLTWSSPLNHMKRAAFSEHNLKISDALSLQVCVKCLKPDLCFRWQRCRNWINKSMASKLDVPTLLGTSSSQQHFQTSFNYKSKE